MVEGPGAATVTAPTDTGRGGAPEVAAGAAGRHAQPLEWPALLAALIAVGIGLVVLLGWATGLGILSTFLPGAPATKANAAILLLLLGLALALRAARRVSRVADALAIVVAAVAFATLLEYAVGIDLGIDRLFVTDVVGPGAPYPGRMALSTALALILGSLAVGLLGRSWLTWRSRTILALIVGLVGGLGVLGNLYGASELTALGSATQIAPPAALAFVVLAAGLIAAEPRHGLMPLIRDQGLAGQLTRRITLTIAVVLPVAGWLDVRLVGDGLVGDGVAMAAIVGFEVLVLGAAGIWTSGGVLRLERARTVAEGERDQQLEISTRLISAIDRSTDGIVITDRDRRIVYANAVFGRNVGHEPAELVGMDLMEVTTAVLGEALGATVAAGDEGEWIREVDRPGPDGTPLRLEVRSTPIRGPHGDVSSWLGMHRDVTATYQARVALETSERQLRTALDTMLDGVAIYRAVRDVQRRIVDFRVDYANSAIGLISGTAASLQAGRTLLELLPAHRANGLLEAYVRVVETGVPFQSEAFRYVDADAAGGPLDQVLDLRAARIGDGCVLSVRDVTQHVEAEQVLVEQRALLDALMDNTPDHIYYKDADSRFTMISRALATSFGLGEASQAVGKADFDFFTDEHARRAFEDEQEIIRTGVPVIDLEERETRLDGRETWVSTTKLARTDRAGNIVGTFGISRDITARKQAERELQETNARLEEAIGQATEMTLRADAANAAKSEFLANMSHEIRTPMNGVIGMIGLLLDTDLDEAQRHYAETVRASGESLLDLLNDILDFSKIEAGGVELEMLGFDLRALLDDFAVMPAMRAHEKGLEFICAAAPDVPARLVGDPGRLRQVLINLAGNAMKFTHHGEISVRAGLVAETEGDVVVRFSVKDTGIGIAPESQARMFEKFTQADASTTRRYGGTGLGLAISKRLVELMGGEIGLNSAEGRGSEFWFTVRLAKQAESDRRAIPAAELRGARILVVDDNATNREVLSAQLRAWDARPQEASDGPSALIALAHARDAGDPYVAAILDMQMPDMDGADVARAIKADATLKDTRLVLLTSVGQRGDARQMQEIGFSAYLMKPTRQSDLFDSLSAVLAGSVIGHAARHIVTRHAVREMRRGAIRILLAEDNVTNQQVALGILRKLGLRADAVGDGAEAVRALKTTPYDLVLMDVQMPEMDGLEATATIRDPRSAVLHHHVPIIAMTAHAMQGDRDRCLEAGMDDYVTKPISPEALALALDRWLPREEPDPAPPATSRAPAMRPPTARAGATGPDPGAPGTRSDAAPGFAAAPVFDAGAMMDRLMGDEELARIVVSGFLEDAPRLVEALRASLEAGDAAAAIRGVHTIRGASATVGGEAVRVIAWEMEKAGTSGDFGAMSARLPELNFELGRLREAMGVFAAGIPREAHALA